MKDAYGGAFSIWLFMVFFVIYVCFIAVALQFAKTYRVKNYVINFLEQQQYDINSDDLTMLDNGSLMDYLNNVPYKVPNDPAVKDCTKYGADYDVEVSDGSDISGICIVNKGTDEAPYYKVFVYFIVEFPFLDIDAFAIPVTGETKVITLS